MVKYVFHITCILFAFSSSNVICQSTSDIQNIEKNISIADSLNSEFPDQAEVIYLDALSKSDSLNVDSLVLFIIYKLGRKYNRTSRPQKYIDLTNSYFKSHDTYKDQPLIYANSALLKYSAYLKVGDYENSIKEILLADSLISVWPRLDKNAFLPTNLFIANIYSKQDQYQKTIELSLKGLNDIKVDNNYHYSYAYKLLYEAYFLEDSLKQSSIYYHKYIDKLKIHEKSLKFRAYHFSNFHHAMQSFATEEKLLQLHESLKKDKRNYSIQTDIGFVLASLYEKKSNYKKAIKYWKNGLFKEEDNDNYNLYPVSKIYNTYLKINEVDSAAIYMKMYNDINQRVAANKRKKEIEDLNTKYQTSLKDAEINKQQLIIEKQRREKNSIITSSIIGILMLLGTIWFLFMHLKHKKRLIENEVILKNQRISELEKEKKILSMSSMIEGQEAERVRIAKDLHDGLGGLLATVKAHFSNIQNEIKKIEKLKVYNKANLMIDEACDEVRRISHNLMPATLKLDGLKSTVEQLSEDLTNAHSFEVNAEFIGFDGTMDEKIEIFIFRIIQEATNNIIKYAQAQKVLLQLTEHTDGYNLIIEDDGIGFDLKNTIYGIGLKSIESRVDYLNGSIDIASKKNEGTTISVAIPKKDIHG